MTSNTILEIACYYGAAAVATGVTSYFSIYKPILRDLQAEGHCLWELKNPLQTALVLISVSTVLAPLLFKMALFGATEEFIDTYSKNVLSHEDEE